MKQLSCFYSFKRGSSTCFFSRDRGASWTGRSFNPIQSGGLEHPPPLLKRFSSYGGGGRGFGLQMGLNGVYCQPSNGLKFNRQIYIRSKKVIFTVNRQKGKLILTVKKFLGTSNLSISANLHGLHAPEESPNWKNHF